MPEAHSFSPIRTEQSFHVALAYLATQAAFLSRAVLGRELPADVLTIFAHDVDEYRLTEKLVRRHGPESPYTHGATLYVDTDMPMCGQRIRLLGVRDCIGDAARPQAGYADYVADDYQALRDSNNPCVHEIVSGRGQQLLEMRHPEFDILGYIVEREGHHDTRTKPGN